MANINTLDDDGIAPNPEPIHNRRLLNVKRFAAWMLRQTAPRSCLGYFCASSPSHAPSHV